MQAQVYQEIDSIRPNLAGHPVGGHAGDVPPAVGKAAEPPVHCVKDGDVAVAENFELRLVALAQQRQDVSTDHVIAKIRRDISETQLSMRLRRAGICMSLAAFPRGVLTIPLPGLLKQP